MTLTEFLDGIEFLDLGGTCYTNNPFFAGLLRRLGYEADLLGADMSRPDVHTTIRVRIDSIAYLVDVGFGAPFREPIRLDRLPARINEGQNRYVFAREHANGRILLTMDAGGERGPGYTVHDPPRPREFFDGAVTRSFLPEATFMNWLRINRVFPGYSLDLIDRKFYRHEGRQTTVRQLASMAELKEAVHGEMRMPRAPVETAIGILESVTGKPFFVAAGAA